MKEKLKAIALEAAGVLMIAVSTQTFRDMANSSAIEGFERYGVMCICYMCCVFGIKFIQEAAPCMK